MQGKRPARTTLIGEEIEVVDATNKTLVGIRGKVIDETKNTLEIMTEEGNKRIIKCQSKIRAKGMTIEGKHLTGRIEARIKQ
jgi:ribonuclease P protein subunit POP4